MKNSNNNDDIGTNVSKLKDPSIFKDSKQSLLTTFLSDCWNGKSKVFFMATISPHDSNHNVTHRVLDFMQWINESKKTKLLSEDVFLETEEFL